VRLGPSLSRFVRPDVTHIPHIVSYRRFVDLVFEVVDGGRQEL